MSGTVDANVSRTLATALALTVALVTLPAILATPAEAAFSAEGGKKIAFTSDRTTGDEEIFTVNRDGTGLKQLTNNPALDYEPTWQPK